MRKPNLIIPGFAKSGTTSLNNMLIKSNEVCKKDFKEPHTYTWNNKYKNRFDFFKKEYQGVNEQFIIDASTSYLVSQQAIDRIIKDTPNAKFIIIVRDPIDRLISHFNWLSSKGLINKDFKQEILKEHNIKFNYKNHFSGNYKNYIEFSSYSPQIQRLLNSVNQSSVLFLTFETVFKSWEIERQKLEDFLGISLKEITPLQDNKTKSEMETKTKKSLMRRIRKRIKYEKRIMLSGDPRTKRVSSPIFQSISRADVEPFLVPIFEKEYDYLKTLPIDLSTWKTFNHLT